MKKIISPLFPIPYSLFPTPYSLFPTPYSLFPIPYSLLPTKKDGTHVPSLLLLNKCYFKLADIKTVVGGIPLFTEDN